MLYHCEALAPVRSHEATSSQVSEEMDDDLEIPDSVIIMFG